jgi:hypothetical protein
VKVTLGAAGRATVRFTVSPADSPLTSATFTVIDDVPTAVGVPLNVPVELRVTPEGSPVAVHVYGGVPPVAPKPTENEAPSVTGEMLVVVIFNGAGKMVSARLAEAETPIESFTVTLTENEPGEVGVPLKAPVDDTETPLGKPLADHEYGGVPPVAPKVAE